MRQGVGDMNTIRKTWRRHRYPKVTIRGLTIQYIGGHWMVQHVTTDFVGYEEWWDFGPFRAWRS